MRHSISAILGILLCLSVAAQKYTPSDSKSSITFTIRNMGSGVKGGFSGLQGTIQFNPAELGSSFFKLSAAAATVHTGINARDNHLKKEEYLDVEKHPRISFSSKKITASGKQGEYYVTGTITIKGVEKEISFPFTAKPQNDGMLFSGEFKLNRRDFKVGGSSLIMADNLMVAVSIFGTK